jgi:ankyrin repeat protein
LVVEVNKMCEMIMDDAVFIVINNIILTFVRIILFGICLPLFGMEKTETDSATKPLDADFIEFLRTRKPRAVEDLKLIESYLEKGASVNGCNEEGIRPLHVVAMFVNHLKPHDIMETFASARSSMELFYVLVKKGADINGVDNMGRTPLHVASNMLVIRELLTSDIDSCIRDFYGRSWLHSLTMGECAVFSDDHTNKEVIKRTDIDSKDADGNTPLHYASLNNMPRIVKMLRFCGASTGTQNSEGKTPLHFAAVHGGDCFKNILVEIKGFESADLLAQDRYGCTVLHVAARSGKIEIIDHIIKSLPLLTFKKGFIRMADKKGKTACHYALEKGYFNVINKLNNGYGAGFQVPPAASAPPLEFPIKEESQLSLFQDAVSSLTTSNVVLYEEQKEPADRACAAQCEVRPEDNGALLEAIECQDEQKVKMLLEIPCGVLTCDKHGRTPLHYAALKQNIFIMILLWQKGADCSKVDNVGKTPLDLLSEELRLILCEVIRQ